MSFLLEEAKKVVFVIEDMYSNVLVEERLKKDRIFYKKCVLKRKESQEVAIVN